LTGAAEVGDLRLRCATRCRAARGVLLNNGKDGRTGRINTVVPTEPEGGKEGRLP